MSQLRAQSILTALFLAAAACVGVVWLGGCTLYQGCASIYGEEKVMGVSLTEACSRGVTFRRKSIHLAHQDCRSNYFSDESIGACERGIRLYEDGKEGRVIHDGLDDSQGGI
ncbi:MAG TPA: hypothetical protein VL588_01095 [Bdellovibrionota bacterium]|jgi:hypothetical protein|nr:hypothetical protein [Bdellovibrionota bacterium]